MTTPIWITSIQAFTGNVADTGEDSGIAQRISAEIMLEEINKNTAVLPNHELKVVWQDDHCDSNSGYTTFLENLFYDRYEAFAPGVPLANLDQNGDGTITQSDTDPLNKTWTSTTVTPDPVGLLGPGCSATAERVVEVAYHSNFPMVSASAASSPLNDRGVYSNFFRTLLPDVNVSYAFLSLAEALGQRSLVAIAGATDTWDYTSNLFAEAAASRGIRLVGNDTCCYPSIKLVSSDMEGIDNTVTKLIVLRKRIVVFLLDRQPIQLLLCQAHSRGYHGSVYMTFGRYESGWWQESASCGKEALLEASNGLLSASMLYWRHDSGTRLSCSSSMTAFAFRSEWLSRQASLIDRVSSYVPSDEAASMADAVCLYAQMLHEVLFTRNVPLADLAARTSSAYAAVQEALSGADYEGLQGRVRFPPHTANPLSSVKIQQLQGGKMVDIAFYNQSSLNFLGLADLVLPYPGESVFAGPAGASRLTVNLAQFVQCPQHQIMDFKINSCIDCPANMEAVPARGTCLCSAGFHVSGDTCMACQAGRFALNIGSQKCTDCGPGLFSPNGSSRCSFCERGRYSTQFGSSGCQACPSLQTTGVIAATSAEDCGCEETAYFTSADGHFCQRCPANAATGTFHGENVSSCLCKEDMYMSSDFSQCIPCPRLSSTLARTGRTSVSQCYCEAGKFMNGNFQCEACPVSMTCPEGSNQANRQFLHDVLTGTEESVEVPVEKRFPLLRPRHWASASEPFSVFKCRDEYRCPGGRQPGNACAGGLTTRACEHCPPRYWWHIGGCRACSSVSSSPFWYPVLPILAAPVVILAFYKTFGDALPKWGSWQNAISALLFIVLNHYQILGIVGATNLKMPDSATDTLDAYDGANDFSTGFNRDCLGLTTLMNAMISKALYPAIVGISTILIHLVAVLLERAFPECSMDRNRLFNVWGSIMFTFFGAISALSMTLFKCSMNPNGKYSLAMDLSVVCFSSEEWLGALGLGIACVCLYIIGMGSVFIYAIYVAPRRFNDPGFQMRWKFLFIKFHAGAYWWGIVFLLKNFLVNLVPTIWTSEVATLYLTMSLVLVYLTGTVVKMPYRSEVANLFEFVACVSIIYVTSLLTWHADREDKITKQITQSTVAVSFMPMMMLVVAVAFLALRARRSTMLLSSDALKRLKDSFAAVGRHDDEGGILKLQSMTNAERQSLISAAQALRADWLGLPTAGRINETAYTGSEYCVLYKDAFTQMEERSRGNGLQGTDSASPLASPQPSASPSEQLPFRPPEPFRPEPLLPDDSPPLPPGDCLPPEELLLPADEPCALPARKKKKRTRQPPAELLEEPQRASSSSSGQFKPPEELLGKPPEERAASPALLAGSEPEPEAATALSTPREAAPGEAAPGEAAPGEAVPPSMAAPSMAEVASRVASREGSASVNAEERHSVCSREASERNRPPSSLLSPVAGSEAEELPGPRELSWVSGP